MELEIIKIGNYGQEKSNVSIVGWGEVVVFLMRGINHIKRTVVGYYQKCPPLLPPW